MSELVSAAQIAALYPNADEAMQLRIERAVEMVNQNAVPRSMQAHYEVDDTLDINGFVPRGQDIRRHLAGATQVIVGVCTIGAAIDRVLERLKVGDLATAYLVDVAAGWAVENLAERDCADLKQRAEAEGYRVTTRYSCGYGDFDLSGQKPLLQVTGAGKALGIQVNEGGMMYPTKTITYLVGLVPTR